VQRVSSRTISYRRTGSSTLTDNALGAVVGAEIVGNWKRRRTVTPQGGPRRSSADGYHAAALPFCSPAKRACSGLPSQSRVAGE
jgi:hypothetical protein